jgi:hypothetical protein
VFEWSRILNLIDVKNFIEIGKLLLDMFGEIKVSNVLCNMLRAVFVLLKFKIIVRFHIGFNTTRDDFIWLIMY